MNDKSLAVVKWNHKYCSVNPKEKEKRKEEKEEQVEQMVNSYPDGRF